MTIDEAVQQIGDQAVTASQALAQLSSDQKNKILLAMADALNAARSTIKVENAKDYAAAKSKGVSDALLDRLTLTDERIDTMIDSFHQVVALEDPIGTLLQEFQKDNGLQIKKCRVPIGVIGIIYESRPNVTADVAALCLKTGNAVILRGGTDAIHSNRIIADALLKGGQSAGLPEYALQLVQNRTIVTIGSAAVNWPAEPQPLCCRLV